MPSRAAGNKHARFGGCGFPAGGGRADRWRTDAGATRQDRKPKDFREAHSPTYQVGYPNRAPLSSKRIPHSPVPKFSAGTLRLIRKAAKAGSPLERPASNGG